MHLRWFCTAFKDFNGHLDGCVALIVARIVRRTEHALKDKLVFVRGLRFGNMLQVPSAGGEHIDWLSLLVLEGVMVQHKEGIHPFRQRQGLLLKGLE